MSLKFGIYLVEQRIVTPQQFCGLVKIQQESVQTAAKIALQRNLMTIKQVSTVLDTQMVRPKNLFHNLAVEMKYITAAEADQLVKAQENSSTSMRELLVECGLLTQSQCRALYSHFERMEIAARAARVEMAAVAAAAPPVPATSAPVAEAPKATTPVKPRSPNFKRRPVIHQSQVEV